MSIIGLIRNWVIFLAVLPISIAATTYSPAPLAPDQAKYNRVSKNADFVRREIMIPMRDDVRLYTVIVMPKNADNAPILLSRGPYDSARITWRIPSELGVDILPVADSQFIDDGYIRVYQDVRGAHRSEGEYVLNRPLQGTFPDDATIPVDHSTDAYDTIEWLVTNLPQTNGNVGVTGSSYLGFTSLMALINPHPALKAAVPMSPMVNGWIGDDWFHNGAFRQSSFELGLYLSTSGAGGNVPLGERDHYSAYLESGSAGAFAKRYNLNILPIFAKFFAHPAYDAYWQSQALEEIMRGRSLTVPTMIVTGQWDQEDSYGAQAVYTAMETHDVANDMVFFVMGPWRHSGVLHDGSKLGTLSFAGDTAQQFRGDVMKPFFDRYLRNADAPPPPAVLTYATGKDRWQRSDAWPAGKNKALFLQAGQRLGWSAPANIGRDTYLSDPANPVPFLPRPIDLTDSESWQTWLVTDQRFLGNRQDVLTYQTAPLEKPLEIAGSPEVDLWAATSGTDSDWVVKLIDVAPDGTQLPIGIEIFRGRYHAGFAKPSALKPNQAENYRFALPPANHFFASGHKIMVQIQSSLFPLYDRNPQSYVENIFFAGLRDYNPATQTILRGGAMASAIYLPIAEQGTIEPVTLQR